jgi:aldehyde:ferredoxin oxidoreductase
MAENLGTLASTIQQLRWKNRLATGFVPEEVTIPKRFHEITTIKGPLDSAFLSNLMVEYGKAIRVLGQ